MKIRTNRQWRHFLYREEVPADVLASQFDWLDADTCDGFIRYRGWYYHLSQFERREVDGWHGVAPDSYFSGVLIRLSDDGETYQIGTYFS